MGSPFVGLPSNKFFTDGRRDHNFRSSSGARMIYKKIWKLLILLGLSAHNDVCGEGIRSQKTIKIKG